MSVSNLEKYYGVPCHCAYFEIKRTLKKYNFDWIQGSTYITQSDDLGNLFRAIEALKKSNGLENLFAILGDLK